MHILAKQDDNEWDARLFFITLIILAVLGFLCLGTFQYNKGFATLTASALAALTIGGLAGFLFGIPRKLQITAKGTDASASDELEPRLRYEGNTNLEEISDWLTKIIIGIGIANFKEISDYVGTLAKFAGSHLSWPSASAYIVSIWVFFGIIGFLFGFLWARLYLSQAFDAAETRRRIKKAVDEAVSAHDAALKLVVAHLEKDKADWPTLDQLAEAVRRAPYDVTVQVYNLAARARLQGKFDAALAIFSGLNEANPERYHANYAQMAFANMEKSPPDYREAERLLTKAIEIRDIQGGFGHTDYEMKRAICRIRMDPNFEKSEQSTIDALRRIRSDLMVAKKSTLEAMVAENQDLKKWLDLNDPAKDAKQESKRE